MLQNAKRGHTLSRRDFVRFSATGAAVALFSAFTSNAMADVVYPENMDLTDEEVASRMREIHGGYSVGDFLSESDVEFVNMYGFNPYNRASWSFGNSRNFAGNTYSLSGYKYLNNTWSDQYTYGGTVQGGSSTVVSNYVTTYYSIMAYGLVGVGYQVIYQNTDHKTCYGVSWCTHEYYGSFFGACSTQTISCWAEFGTNSGSFVVSE